LRETSRPRAACRAREASIAFEMTFFARWVLVEELGGFWFTTCCTKPRTHGLPSFVLVCPSNCGSRA
jgi:hypothetical protein